jgi:thymidylate synthase (FAD)
MLYQVKQYPVKDGIGYVELLDHMGSDITIVNAARVSYAKESAELGGRDVKLLNFLMTGGHGSPFEHVVFRFRVKAPLFVVHQWERHRMASYNEESGRWIKMGPEFYIPQCDLSDTYEREAQHAYDTYLWLLDKGETKERARQVLPLSLYKTFWFTVNARSLLNFLALRNDDHAQWEIQMYAKALEDNFAAIMPNTWAAFEAAGRVAP